MSPPVLRLRAISGRTAAEQLAEDLCVPPSASSNDTIFELVRAIAWASTRGQTPVSQGTLLDRATDASASLDDSTELDRRERLDAALYGLESSGDLAYLGRGQWLSSPGYVTDTESELAPQRFLVGGVPLRHLSAEQRACIVLQGPTRRIANSGADLCAQLPLVSFDAWTRKPADALALWTNEMMEIPLRQPVKGEVATSVFGFYRPGRAAIQAKQQDRWFSPDEHLHGRLLARETRINGSTDYAIVELDCGRMTGILPCGLDDARRLMYGLDQAQANPTRATWGTTGGQTIGLKLGSPLPQAETRRLLGIGGIVADGTWTIPAGNEVPVQVLEGLGIKV